MRQPGIEPRTTAWKAAMLTITPLTLHTKTDEVTSSLGRHLLPLALALFWVIFFYVKKKKSCANRESNPEQQLGKLLC